MVIKMRQQERATARRQLDKRLNILRNLDGFARPSRGWIKAIREALGMPTAQLAKRMGVSQPRAVAIEQAEGGGSITLDTLERAARALDCRLVYALVPRKPFQELAEERALHLAEKRLASTRHTMALEAQSVDAADEQEQVRALARRLLERAGSALWDDE
ncbi:MAG: mobile mystery protein A [Alphaproteobacteria bacterium]